MRLPVRDYELASGRVIAAALACALLAGCGGGDRAGLASASASGKADFGPEADYPVLVGEPYQIAGVTFTPVETLNYDEVGMLAGPIAAKGYVAAHHTLPVPSYVEVTSLVTGRTILARIEQRGPMDSTQLLGLSPAALAQLEATPETPVRVRRVNPPEEQRAMLRAGKAAPLRMDTPMSLVTVLRRKLPAGAAEFGNSAELAGISTEPATHGNVPPTADSAPAAVTAANDPLALPPLDEVEAAPDDFGAAFALGEAAAEPVASPAEQAAKEAQQPEADNGFLVQAAAFSTRDRANRAASSLGGNVTESGRYFRVRTGPFATRGEAEASLANVRAAGYTDARILTSG